MGCVTSRATREGAVSQKVNAKSALGSSQRTTVADRTERTDADYLAQFVAGYTTDYPQKGTVTTYEDYRGFETSVTNHMSKNKADKMCKWGDQALQDRQAVNNDFFFNPHNPSMWPKDVLVAYFTSPSFSDRRTIQDSMLR